MAPTCCAVDCVHNEKNFPCKLKRFPADEQRSKIWENNIKRDMWERKKWHKLCSCHFDDNQWYDKNGKKLLKPDAVPLIFSTHNIAGRVLKNRKHHRADTNKIFPAPIIAPPLTPEGLFPETIDKVLSPEVPVTDEVIAKVTGNHAEPEIRKVTMVRTCCVVMCGHNNKYCRMRKFPADKKRAAIWQMNVGRPDWERKDTSLVCECHFDETQFEKYVQDDGQRKLRQDAIPLIFPTHILVVHDPAGENKWHSPEPRQPQPTRINTSEASKEKLSTSKIDHTEAMGTANDNLIDDSKMCDSFCEVEVLEELQKEVLGPSRTNKITPPRKKGPSSNTSDRIKENVLEKATPDQSRGQTFEALKRTHNSPKSPVKFLKTPDGRTNGPTTSHSSTRLLRIPDASSKMQTSPQSSTKCIATPDTLNKKTSLDSPSKYLITMETSNQGIDVPAEPIKTPEVWDLGDENDQTLESPEVLKDALSFLQFMLPQKWMAFSDNSGIHVALLSKTRAKVIQRSVFAPFNGAEAELYVHAEKLSNNHKMFDDLDLNEREPLTKDSLGSYVDKILNIVQMFSSYEICCGVTDEEFVQEWRKFEDCILDRNSFGEEKYSQTVRSVTCKWLAPKDAERCEMCEALYEV